MSPTVHDLRNLIRERVGRFRREVDAQFTKEELAAIAETVGVELADGRPSKGAMRAAIRREVGIRGGDDAVSEGTFTKADLETIAETLSEG